MTPTLSLLPPSQRSPVNSIVHTHARTNVTPCFPHYYHFSFFLFELEVLDQIFKQLIFLSLTCVFIFYSLVCSPLFLSPLLLLLN